MSDEYKGKLAIIIRKDLRMRIGKIVAQSVHAAVGACHQSLNSSETLEWMKHNYERCAVALKVYSEEELQEIKSRAVEHGLNVYIQQDAGLTQVAPDSFTVMAIGPTTPEKLQPVIGGLKLF
jgi:PTH2 family peptidyl-tRNA hydrolase